MKYCTNCGGQIHDEAVVCVNCGTYVQAQPAAKTNDTMATVVKIFMVIGCVAQAFAIVPLFWCIPMTISVFNRLKEGRPVSTGLSVCTLLFVNLIAGICLLCMDK